MSYYVSAPRAWGARGNKVDDQGNVVAGTSAVDTDLDRYANMTAPAYNNGPGIAHAQSDRSRRVGLDALGMMDARARGAVTPAQTLARQQTAGAVNAVQSGAASVKGGAGARAAAGRMAASQGARVQALGNQDTNALAAREQADAAGQMQTAATGIRGADLSVATEQAKLNAGQRSANEQRDQFYENLGYSTQKARTDQQLGRSAADEAAGNASRVQSLNEAAAGRQQVQQVGSGVIGGVTGGLDAYAKTQAPPQQAPPRAGLSQRSDPYTDPYTSDVRAKEDVEPMGYRSAMTSDADAKREAYAMGRKDAVAGKGFDEVPDFAKGDAPPSDERRAASSWARRAERPKAQKSENQQRAEQVAKYVVKDEVGPTGPLPLRAAQGMGAAVEAIRDYPKNLATAAGTNKPYGVLKFPERAPEEQPMSPPPGAPAPSPGFSEYAARARAMLSDVRTKDTGGSDDMADANRSMAPFSYAYKPKWAAEAGQEEGERNVGPMAQNMAADPVAKTAIVKGEDGMLAIDRDKAMKLTMGGLADLQQQVDQLKNKRAK